MTRVILRNAVGLGLFAMVTAGLIAVTQQLTADDIAIQKKRAQASALLEVIPGELHDNELADSSFIVEAAPELGLQSHATGYRATLGDTVSGVVLPVVAPDGYAGAIRLVLGIDRGGKLLGVRVLEHNETPGLGDQIEARKSDWILDFKGKSLGAPEPSQWQVKKHGGAFDQFTGATITPNAVISAVKRGLEYFRMHRQALLGDAKRVPGTISKTSQEFL